MRKLIRIFVLLSTTLVVGCASDLLGKSFNSATGEWNWEFRTPADYPHSGKMTIIDETKATYTWDSGRILFYATNDQGRWEGYWVEKVTGTPCSVKKDGSNNWGVAIFQFNDAYDKFEGTYDMCGKGQKYPWSGSR